MQSKKPRKLLLGLCILAGIIYNSWPIGYIVNYPIARIGLASDLEAIGQPYNWLFIALDTIVGISTLIIVALMYYRKPFRSLTTAWHCIALGLLLFGAFTALSALIPLDCSASITACGIAVSQVLGFHDITGAISAFGLFMSLVGVVMINQHYRSSLWNYWLAPATLVGWSINGLIYLAYVTSQEARIIQEVFLILSGLAVIVIGGAISASGQWSDPINDRRIT